MFSEHFLGGPLLPTIGTSVLAGGQQRFTAPGPGGLSGSRLRSSEIFYKSVHKTTLRFDLLFMIRILEWFVDLYDLDSSVGISWNDGFWETIFLLTFLSLVLEVLSQRDGLSEIYSGGHLGVPCSSKLY